MVIRLVNQADFGVWRGNFGEMLPPPGAGAILAFSSDTASADLSSESAAALAADYGALAGLASGASSNPSYVALGPSAPVPTSQPIVDATTDQPTDTVRSNTTPTVSSGSSLTSVSQFAAFVTDSGPSAIATSPVAGVDQTSTANTAVSNSDLLLLDQTWADLDHDSYDHADESLYNDQTPKTDSTNDLALAAVLSEDDNQWNSI